MTLYAGIVPLCLSILAGAITAAAQIGNPSREPADPWPGTFQDGQLRMELAAHGAGYSGNITSGGAAIPFSARRKGDSLEGSISLGGQELVFTATLAGNVLTVLTPDGVRHTLRRQGGATPSQTPATAPAAGGIAGEWRSPQGSMRFAPDGSAVINGSTYRYVVREHVLVLIGSEGDLEAPFELKGNTLTLTLMRRPVNLERVTPNTPPASSSSGGRPVELAGMWCYQSNVYANNGGAASASICFVLNADGSYEYNGLRDSYNPFGGATSEAHDAGTWTATETSITFQSRSKGPVTYRLQKQNHPKTGDPMLILNGMAFATHYQKAPWR